MADQFQIVIPWQRPPGDPLLEPRVRACNAVLTHLEGTEMQFKLSPPLGDWSRAAARNAGALNVERAVVVFNDADTIVGAEQIRRAAWQAVTAPGLVYAYDLYLRLTRESSEAMMRGETPHWPVPEREILNAPSMGCAAISLECFREVGGFDESYVGWGYEDVDFANRCAALWPLRRVPGPAFHLWHGDRRPDDSPEDASVDEVEANERRLHGGDPLIGVRRGPLTVIQRG